METNKVLRGKIRDIIKEYQMGSDNFFMHGQGGEKFPYEKGKEEKDKEEQKEIEQKALDLGMEKISGAGLHQTDANM